MTLIALMAQSGGGQVEEIARTFGVDWPHLGAQIVSFSIVCALLYWFAYQPVLRMLEERRRQIAQGIANTEKINAALAAIAAERQTTIAAAQNEAAQLIAEARDIATKVRAREAQQAAVAAEQILERARSAADAEHTRMLAEVKREVAQLVVKTTAKVTGKVLTAEDQRRLSEETARELTA